MRQHCPEPLAYTQLPYEKSGGLAITNVGEVGITDVSFMKTVVYTDEHFLRECRVLVHQAEEQAGDESSFEYSAGHSVMVSRYCANTERTVREKSSVVQFHIDIALQVHDNRLGEYSIVRYGDTAAQCSKKKLPSPQVRASTCTVRS